MAVRNIAKYLTLALWVFVQAGAQSESTKVTAVRQMRQIAEEIKKCPEEIQSQTEYGVYFQGPPSNVEWDVLPSKSVRAPFQGWLEFTLPHRWEETEKAKRSSKLHTKYMNYKLYQVAYGLKGRFRYEFDLGSDSPELVKMLWLDDKTQRSEAVNPGGACWQNFVRPEGAVTGDKKDQP
jgi:hypothetical protein